MLPKSVTANLFIFQIIPDIHFLECLLLILHLIFLILVNLIFTAIFIATDFILEDFYSKVAQLWILSALSFYLK